MSRVASSWPSPRRPCVILGQAPAVDGGAPWAADSASGRRLAALAGVEPDQLPRLFALDNLLPIYMPSHEALREAGELYQFLPGWHYVLAGSQVVKALGTRARPRGAGTHDGPGVLRWFESREGVVMAVLPHPSGRNRWYNDAGNAAAAGRFVRRARWTEADVAADPSVGLNYQAHRAWRADRARHDVARNEARRKS